MKTFLVKGIALVPVDIEVKIQAENQASAINEASDVRGRQLEMCIVAHSYGDDAVHSFVPHEAEEIK